MALLRGARGVLRWARAGSRVPALRQGLAGVTHAEWYRRRAELRAIAEEIRACPTCSVGPYCHVHPKALHQELALAQDELLERSAPGAR